ncbi:pentraxin-related protein PTX3-like [Gouania willdenowi]|uniref:pentraxin-related protein PTX3-like n=1 Tax=Gouania willdenowi TaxID=441366 RepID=UPI0010551DD8|nr:pentraxin-related protein PTX3-like [Gouania willdenowi]
MMWGLVCVLMVYVTSSLCGNNFDYEGNYVNIYDNMISEAQQDGNSPPAPPTPLAPPPAPCHADLSRWDKLFIFLEDSEMRQRMLQEAVEQCCAGMRVCVDRRRKGEELQQSLVELRADEVERERRMNSTLHMLLQLRHEDSGRLKRLEEEVMMMMMMMGRTKPLTPGLKEPGRTSSLQRSLTSIQSDLQKLQLQINKVIDEEEETKKNRGDMFTVTT